MQICGWSAMKRSVLKGPRGTPRRYFNKVPGPERPGINNIKETRGKTENRLPYIKNNSQPKLTRVYVCLAAYVCLFVCVCVSWLVVRWYLGERSEQSSTYSQQWIVKGYHEWTALEWGCKPL